MTKRHSTTARNVVFAVLVVSLIAGSLLLLTHMQDFTGYLSYMLNASGGEIQQLIIYQRHTTGYWSGASGLFNLDFVNALNRTAINLTAGEVRNVNIKMDCFGSTGTDIYFSETWYTGISYPVQAATWEDVDNYMGLQDDVDASMTSASKTLTENISVNFGGSNITTIGTYSNQYGQPDARDFDTFVLKDAAGHLLFGTHISGLATGYDNKLYNFQVMLPFPGDKSQATFYAYADPLTDPFGTCGQAKNVLMYGYVTDNQTGLPIENVTVAVGGSWVTETDANGYYTMIVNEGNHYLISRKDGYLDYITLLSFVFGQPKEYNFSMIPSYGLGMPAGVGFINGTVRDSSTGLPVENATVSVGVNSTISDSLGKYHLVAFSGNATIVALKSGYDSFVKSVTINNLQTINIEINLTPMSGLIPPRGNISGFVFDTSGVPVENATVYLAEMNISAVQTNQNGSYLLTAPEGQYFIVAEKYGYRRYLANLSVWRFNITYYNITLVNVTMPNCSNIVFHNLEAYQPQSYEFSSTCLDATVTVVVNTSQSNRYIQGEYYTSTPSDLPIPSFLNLGRYYNFATNINQSTLENSSFILSYNESDIMGQFNESYITPYYYDNSTKEWVELNISYGPDSTYLSGLDTENNTVRFFAGPRKLSYYVLGLRSTRLYGTVTSGSPLANVSVYASGGKTISSDDGNYTIDAEEGLHYLIAIKEGYNTYVYEYNITKGQWLRYDISMVAATQPGLGAGQGEGSGAGSGAGLGAGEGPGTGQPTVEKPSSLLMYVSLDEINKRIRKGTFVDETLSIFNLKQDAADLYFTVDGDVAPYIVLSKTEALMAPNSTFKLGVRLLGSAEPGIYTGILKISGDLDVTIPIEMTVLREGKIPLKSLLLAIDSLTKSVYRGEEFRYKVDITNLLTSSDFDVDLNFTLSNINQTIVYPLGEQTANVATFMSILRKAQLPEDIELGDYVLSVEATYLGYSSTANTLIEVRDPFYKYNLFGVFPVWLLSTILGTILLGYFIVMIVKKQQAKKKRFNAKVEYKEMPSEGPRSIFVGYIAETKHRCLLDMDNLTVHTIVAGSTGGGKSIAAQDIVEECLLKGVAVAVFDPTAQWSGMLRKLQDKKFLAIYPNFSMDPKKDPKAFPGNIKAIKDHREIVDIFKYLKPGEIQVFTTNTLDPKNYDIFVANMIRQIFHSKLDEFRGLKYLVVFDEIHRILPKFGGSGQGFLQIERGCREFRKWGIGIVLISQVLSDFVGEIKANINTQVQMKTRDEGDLNRIKMQYGEEYIQALVKAPVGSGMVQNAAYNRGRPFYVTFRPILHSVERLKDEELDEYNKYNSIVEDLEYQFEQLEELKQDVFDLKLELKLSKDKIKSGNFNMVKIYLDGLIPRVNKFWEKLGKTPKKLEIKLVSEDELKADLEAAKAAKKKFEAENQSSESAAPKQEEAEVKMDPKQVEENLKAAEKLFKNMEESIASKDYFAVNDRIIEVKSLPLPKDKKAEMQKRIDEVNARIEALKSGKQPEAAATAPVPSSPGPAAPSASPTQQPPQQQ